MLQTRSAKNLNGGFMKLTLMTCFLLMLLSLNVSAKVREADFKISGLFENLDESILKLKSGEVSLFDSKDCGFFKCHARSFILKGQEDSLAISLNKEGIKSFYEYQLNSFEKSFRDFSLTASNNLLKLNFSRILKDTTEEFQYKIVPESCEEICTNRQTYCQFGDADEEGKCRGRTETRCEESHTTCTPSYEVCYRVSHSKASVLINFLNLKTNEIVGRFTSKEVPSSEQEKVPMPKCFGR